MNAKIEKHGLMEATPNLKEVDGGRVFDLYRVNGETISNPFNLVIN